MKRTNIKTPDYIDSSWMSEKSRDLFVEAIESYTEKRYSAKWKIDEGKTRDEVFRDVEMRMFSHWNYSEHTVEGMDFEVANEQRKEQEKLLSVNQNLRKQVIEKLKSY